MDYRRMPLGGPPPPPRPRRAIEYKRVQYMRTEASDGTEVI